MTGREAGAPQGRGNGEGSRGGVVQERSRVSLVAPLTPGSGTSSFPPPPPPTRTFIRLSN